jgi:hypothetical protein
MKIRRSLALGGATLALVLMLTSAALAAGTTVSVRVEGLKRTLLESATVHTHSGWIRKGGTPSGVCAATTAAGALDLATKHEWNGTYSSSLGLELTSIFGEKHTFSSPYYWSIWVNNRYAPAGLCGLKLTKGERLMFAAVSSSASANPLPLGLSGPATATKGHAFRLKVVSYNGKGASKPLAGVHLGGGVSNSAGIVTVTESHTGTYRFTASQAGYIRSARVSVRVGS